MTVITIVDLENVVKVIDHACSAGAFRGWDVISQVAETRSKLVTFINQEKEKSAEITNNNEEVK